MSVYIHDIATSVPPFFSDQQEIREIMKKYVGTDRKSEAIIHRIYSHSGIKKRYSVVEDFAPNKNGTLFFNGEVKSSPSTSSRNKIYEKEARKLFIDVGQKLLESSAKFSAKDVTHVVTVSCTGFFAPGPDYEVVKALGLKPNTQRFHIGFMGCYAAFPAMKMARSFCENDPDAVVLVICTELCTLHFQFKNEVDNLISGSVFADGAGGLLVSSQKPASQSLEIRDFASSLVMDGEKDMAWTIGDEGFDMILSSYVPDIIKNNLNPVLQPLYDQYGLTRDEIDYWALHPGGRSILDKIQDSLELTDSQITASRDVLAEYGNMSSATILFVLKKWFNSDLKHGQQILSMAFGPGLTIESGLMSVFHPNSDS